MLNKLFELMIQWFLQHSHLLYWCINVTAERIWKIPTTKVDTKIKHIIYLLEVNNSINPILSYRKTKKFALLHFSIPTDSALFFLHKETFFRMTLNECFWMIICFTCKQVFTVGRTSQVKKRALRLTFTHKYLCSGCICHTRVSWK